jgi:hypothetical protein
MFCNRVQSDFPVLVASRVIRGREELRGTRGTKERLA